MGSSTEASTSLPWASTTWNLPCFSRQPAPTEAETTVNNCKSWKKISLHEGPRVNQKENLNLK